MALGKHKSPAEVRKIARLSLGATDKFCR